MVTKNTGRRSGSGVRSTISAVLIVKDEEAALAQCLESVAWADQIVVYDTGSSDATVEIARRFTDTVVEGYWDDDFGAARNRALAHATGDWVMSIDADEVFDSPPDDLRRSLARTSSGVCRLTIANLSGDPLSPEATFLATRLFRRLGHRWVGRLHEQVRTSSGSAPRRTDLPDVHLTHSGYADVERTHGVKADRNIAIARRELAELDAAGSTQAADVARVHLVRSLLVGRRLDEAVALAEVAWQPQSLPVVVAVALASNLVDELLAVRDLDRAERWLERWASVDRGGAYPMQLVRFAALRGRTDDALTLLDALPERSVDHAGGVVDRSSIADLEVALLARAGRPDDAERAAAAALAAGSRALDPVALLADLGERAVARLIPELDGRTWRDWALKSCRAGNGDGLLVLRLMARARPDELAPAWCAAELHRLMSLEEAATWSAALRRHRQAERCPLLAFANDRGRPADQRALAAALLVSAYGDDRGRLPLAGALGDVPAPRRASLAEELAVVAPGLRV